MRFSYILAAIASLALTAQAQTANSCIPEGYYCDPAHGANCCAGLSCDVAGMNLACYK